MTPFDCPRTCPLAGERWCRFRPVLDALGPVRVDSHVAELDVQIADLDALAEAATRLGLEFRRDRKTYRWYGQYVGDSPLPPGVTVDELGTCDHAIGVPMSMAAYEIGVKAKPGGGFTLLWDYWEGGYGLEAFAGEGLKKLTHEYAAVVAERQAEALGWLHERAVDGSLLIHHPSGGTLTVSPGGLLDAQGFLGEGCHAAMLELGLPMHNLTAKPELGQVAAQTLVARK